MNIPSAPVIPGRCRHTPRAGQQGVVLFIALIALVVLTLAGIALVRSVDTSNVISGNLAFKQSALESSDIGVETAFNALPTIISTSLDQDIAGQYFATIQPVDSNGVPTTINWSNVPCRDTAGNVVTCGSSGYSVQYVIDRMCNGPTPVTNVQASCVTDVPLGGGSKKAGAVVFSSATAVYYRVTVRVTGPRNTVSMVQAMLTH